MLRPCCLAHYFLHLRVSMMQSSDSKDCGFLCEMQCITLMRWLGERNENVYKQLPGYSESSAPLLLLEDPLPQDLPDTLRGEQWAFVQLPLPGTAALRYSGLQYSMLSD